MTSLESGLQGHVTLLDKVLESTIEQTLRQGTDGVLHLLHIPALGYEFVSDFDFGLGQVLVQVCAVNTEELTDDFTDL